MVAFDVVSKLRLKGSSTTLTLYASMNLKWGTVVYIRAALPSTVDACARSFEPKAIIMQGKVDRNDQ